MPIFPLWATAHPLFIFVRKLCIVNEIIPANTKTEIKIPQKDSQLPLSFEAASASSSPRILYPSLVGNREQQHQLVQACSLQRALQSVLVIGLCISIYHYYLQPYNLQTVVCRIAKLLLVKQGMQVKCTSCAKITILFNILLTCNCMEIHNHSSLEFCVLSWVFS